MATSTAEKEKEQLAAAQQPSSASREQPGSTSINPEQLESPATALVRPTKALSSEDDPKR